MPLDAFVSKSCPSLYKPYDPPRWMHKYVDWSVSRQPSGKPRFFGSGHVQTAYCVVGDFTQVDNVVYHRQVESHAKLPMRPNTLRRKLLRTLDGGTLYVVGLIPPAV